MIRPRRLRWSGGRTRLDTRSSTNAGKETCFTFSSGNAPDWAAQTRDAAGERLRECRRAAKGGVAMGFRRPGLRERALDRSLAFFTPVLGVEGGRRVRSRATRG